jgi:hypothetical protein
MIVFNRGRRQSGVRAGTERLVNGSSIFVPIILNFWEVVASSDSAAVQSGNLTTIANTLGLANSSVTIDTAATAQQHRAVA